jgi:hypothetical protein
MTPATTAARKDTQNQTAGPNKPPTELEMDLPPAATVTERDTPPNTVVPKERPTKRVEFNHQPEPIHQTPTMSKLKLLNQRTI